MIVGGEGGVLLFGVDDQAGGVEPRATSIEATPRAAGAVLEASESRLADARGDSRAARSVGGEGEDRLSPYRLEIEAFCAAIRTGALLRCGVEMALRTTAACVAANEAMDKKTRVDIGTLLA
jgi:predicted dehydrogenase